MASGVRRSGDAACPAPDFQQTRTDHIVGELDLAISFLEIALAAADRDSARRNVVLARQLLDSIEGSLGKGSLEAGVQSRLDRAKLLFRQYAEAQSERHCLDATLESSVEAVAIQAAPVDQPTQASRHPLQTECQDQDAAVRRRGSSWQAASQHIVRLQRSGVKLASTWARCLRQSRTAWQEIDSRIHAAFARCACWLKSPW